MLPLASTLACASLSAWPRAQGCPVDPVPSADLPESASLRARIQLRIHELEIPLEVVARVQSGELVVVGLAPYGTRLFSVRQRGREFEFEAEGDAGSSARLRTLALFVMDALHRSYWIAPVAADLSAAGPTREPGGARDAQDTRFEWGDEEVSESHSSGRKRRVFTRAGPGSADSADSGVTIEYSQFTASGRAGTVEIRSKWCGYEAVVAVLDESFPPSERLAR